MYIERYLVCYMELVDSGDCVRYYKEKINYFSNKLGFAHILSCELLIYSFIDYIYECENKFLVFHGYNATKRRVVESISPYNHRWSQGYVNRILHRLYRLDDIKIHRACMITMTTYHDSAYAEKMTGRRFSIQDSFEELIHSRAKLIQMLRNMYGEVQYIWILEPHSRSGYPHCHMLVFLPIPPGDQAKLKHIWS